MTMDSRDIRISKSLRKLLEQVEKLVEQEVGEHCGISLLVMPWSRDGSLELAEFQYISNAPREYMHGAMRSLVSKWDSGAPSIPPHMKN